MPRTYFRGPGQRNPQEDAPDLKYYKPQFYDPYFFIQGSEPEKRVMVELVRRGIYFEHTPQTNDIKWGNLKAVATSDPSKWEADFLFPQFKIWLEVQGAYFHTMPGVPEKEALRFAIIEAAGWRPIYWWDYDIEARLVEMMDSVPEFYRPPSSAKGKGGWAPKTQGEGFRKFKGGKSWAEYSQKFGQSHFQSHHNRPRTFGRTNKGLPFYEGGDGVDHLKGLRTANSNRATTPQYKSLKRAKRKVKIRSKFGHG